MTIIVSDSVNVSTDTVEMAQYGPIQITNPMISATLIIMNLCVTLFVHAPLLSSCHLHACWVALWREPIVIGHT